MQLTPRERKLFDIVVEEYKRYVEEQSLASKDGLLDVYLAGIDFASEVFIKNYSFICNYYSEYFNFTKEFDLTEEEKYELIFKEVVLHTSTLIDMSYGNSLYKKHDQSPSEFGLLSKWVYWCGTDVPSENPKNQNIAFINEKGQKIIDYWNAFKNYNKLREE
ncbi:MAG TPA: hypothetical protein VEC16_03020 [Alphaproteobacteria bacterium]|nr:hypothetical protein [Alphaproteobacteria bacterium]